MWDVPRFAEHHRYDAVIVENVVDAYHWQPFRAWLMAMDCLGYDHHIVMLNSMHAHAFGVGAPQSRDRMYVVFWRKGNQRPDIERVTRPNAVCPTCGPIRAMQSFKRPDSRWGRYRAQYVYRCPNVKCRNRIVEPQFRPAADIIDWSLVGTPIGERALKKYSVKVEDGYEIVQRRTLVDVDGERPVVEYTERVPKYRTEEVWLPLAPKTMARIQAGIERYWAPLLVPVEGREGKKAQPVTAPSRTMTTRNETGMAFLTQFRDRVRDLDPAREPLTTVVADGANHGLCQLPAFIAELRGGGSKHRPVSDALCTVTASGTHHGLVTTYYGNGNTVPTTDPLSTCTTVDRHGLITPAGGTWRERATSTTEPIPTRTTRETDGIAMGPAIDINDVRFRMLEPREIIAAMDFPRDYVVLGNRREQVRMAGNAVTPPAARDLVGVVAESLGGAA